MATDLAKNALLNIGSGRPAQTPISTLTANPAAAPAGGTGTTAGAWDTAANRDAAIATINALRTRVAEIETVLKDLGILG